MAARTPRDVGLIRRLSEDEKRNTRLIMAELALEHVVPPEDPGVVAKTLIEMLGVDE